MTINEAIEYLNDLVKVEQKQLNTYTPAALKLGIEALKRIAYDRTHYFILNLAPLPGEARE